MNFIQRLFRNKKFLFLYIGTILLLGVLPLNTSSELNNITILRLRGDYFLHALMFVPWAFFRPVKKLRVFIWLIIGLAFAAGSETLQYFLPYRAFNINDLVANMLGVVIGILVSRVASCGNKFRTTSYRIPNPQSKTPKP